MPSILLGNEKIERKEDNMKISIKEKNEEWRKIICEANPIAPALTPEWWGRFIVEINGHTRELDSSDIEEYLLKEAEGMPLPATAMITKKYTGPNGQLLFIPETRYVFVCNLIISPNFA